MSRYDIADYLALSVETVSRAVTELRHRGAIRLPTAHQVRIVDPRALAEPARAVP
jgi:CRP-like cAMP-binding protein